MVVFTNMHRLYARDIVGIVLFVTAIVPDSSFDKNNIRTHTGSEDDKHPTSPWLW